MKKWLDRIRGALGMGLAWAAAWSVVGAIYGVVLVVSGIDSAGDIGWIAAAFAPASAIGWIAVAFAVAGLIGGTAFSAVLGIAEGRRTFDQMSLPRFAGWGALGGLLLSMVLLLGGTESLSGSALTSGVMMLLGMGSAAGSLALARRADDRELLEHGADVADIGLTEEEKRELLATQNAIENWPCSLSVPNDV